MKIHKIGIRNYRSIGDQPIELDLCKRANILIGPNNAGKSNVLTAIQRIGKDKIQWDIVKDTDRHKRQATTNVGFVLEGVWTPPSESSLPPKRWRFETGEKLDDATPFRIHPFKDLSFHEFNPLMSVLIHREFRGHANAKEMAQKVPEMSRTAILQMMTTMPNVVSIPAFRRIVEGELNIAGAGIIPQLAKWKTPSIGNEQDLEKFEKVQSFLRRLLALPEVEIQVPTTNDQIIVQNGALRLPLENYGTGLHQLIVLAIAVLEYQTTIICMEEPEVHLHPRLQRELLSFLIDGTDNQYVIATHSPSFLSRPLDCNIIRLWMEEGTTISQSVTTTEHSLAILRDIGVSASEIMQSRFVIWVEGPSDAIYIRRWLQIAHDQGIAPRCLVEGIDYSIMWYGGKILSHVTFDRDINEELSILVQLLPINQNAAVIIDSDRAHATSEINHTKQRIVSECEKSGSLAWVTSGREIENYLDPISVQNAYRQEVEQMAAPKIHTFGRLETSIKAAVLKDAWKGSLSYSAYKTKWASKIAPYINSLDRLDLREQIDTLVQRIVSVHA